MKYDINIIGDKLSVFDGIQKFELEFSPAGTWTAANDNEFIAAANNCTWQVNFSETIRIKCFQKSPSNSPVCSVIPQKENHWRMLIHHPIFGYFQSGISKTEKNDEFFGCHDHTEAPLFTLLYDKDAKYGIFGGFQTPTEDDPVLIYQNDRLDCRFFQTAPKLAECELDELIINTGKEPVALLDYYSDTMPQIPEQLKNKIIKGWNSWDYFFQTVTFEDVERNVKAIKNTPGICDEVEYIIIDDGWQNGYGDWEISSRFHDELESTVKVIKNAGYKPGIWVAPFIADYYSKLSLRHPELLARNADGNYEFAAGGNGGIGTVDPTHPEAEKMLKKLFTYLKEIGFEYFKVDFVKYLMRQSIFHDSKRRMDMVTKGMKIIRESIGEDAFLTGCGMPLYSGYGIVNAQRIAGDISTFWSNILSSAREITATFFMHRKAWINDCDFLLIRNPQTTDEEKFNPFFVPAPYKAFQSRSGKTIENMNETLVWASIVLLCGGNIINSDDFSKLNEKGIEICRTVLKYAAADRAIPLDLFESGIPSRWIRQGKNGKTLYAFFNWEDTPAEIHAELAGNCFFNIWEKKNLQLADGIFHTEIPPRSAILLEMQEQNTNFPES